MAKLRSKYFIEFMDRGIERTVYFDKLPADKYKGKTGVYYIMKLTDKGTLLLPIMNLKTMLPVTAGSKKGVTGFDKFFDVFYRTKSGTTYVAKRVKAKNATEAKNKIKKEMSASKTFDKVISAILK